MRIAKGGSWAGRAILIGLTYLVIGLLLSALSQRYGVIWRLAAWIVSGAVYGAQIAYEHFRLGSPPRSIALQAAASAAVGAFGLAVAANLHAAWAGSGNRRLLTLALLAWPVLTGVPAFVIALISALGLGLRKRSPTGRGDSSTGPVASD